MRRALGNCWRWRRFNHESYKYEARNPKSETSTKLEIQMIKTKMHPFRTFEIRISNSFRISCFEFRISLP